MSHIINRLRYVSNLTRMIVADSTHSRISFWMFACMMFVNNVVYFSMWAIYFYNFSSLRGWNLVDLATLMGICSFAYGLTFFFCGGSWNVARMIFSGGLDSYLGRPRAPLLPILMSECRPSSVGDIASSFIFWMVFGKHGLVDLPLLILISTAAAAICLAAMIMIQSLAFWISGIGTAGDTLYEVFLTLTLYPQKLYSPAFQLVLFTLIPAAYVGFLPVEIMRHFSWPMLGAILAAALFYLWLAVAIFNRGLRSYTSGNILQR